MVTDSFDIIDEYLNDEKLVMKFDPLKPSVLQYDIRREIKGQYVGKKYASNNNAARILIADHSDIAIDMRLSIGSKIAIALHWLGLLDANVDTVVILSPEHVPPQVWKDKAFADLVAYDHSKEQIPCTSLVPRGSFLVGKDAVHSFVKWNGPITESLKPKFSEAARIGASLDLKVALAGINVMLSDPDYSTSMKGDTLSKCKAVLSMLSFGKWELDYKGLSYQNMQSRCDPPDDFYDELAEHMEESAQKLSELLSIWKHYAEISPVRFSFP